LACHQLTLEVTGFAIVPHVVDVAKDLLVRNRVFPLSIAGLVAACRHDEHAPTIPNDLTATYLASEDLALKLATDALAKTGWGRGDLITLTAAMHGQRNLALHLLLHGGSDDELHCGVCGEYLVF
jgi:hypothetical protein